jgi:hypothetical protein
MTSPLDSFAQPRMLILVIAVVAVVLGGVLVAVAVQPSSSSGAAGSSTLTVHSHTEAISAGSYSTGATGPVSVHSSSGVVTSSSTTTPTAVNVLKGSAVFVFVGFVNGLAGGGGIERITDSAGDAYQPVFSTGYDENHTLSLFVAEPILANTSLSVSVSFFAGALGPQGGSVSVVDVAGIGTPFVDGVYSGRGDWSGTAYANVYTNHSTDLVLLGVAGMGRIAPAVAGPGDTLLDTGTNTSGPSTDGTGFGTFWSTETGSNENLSATLNTAAEWTSIGVGILGVTGTAGLDTTSTPSISVAPGSELYAFVGYVNPEIGGGTVSSITDSLGDVYSLLESTAFALNHSESFYEAGPIARESSVSVTVTMTGGATTMGCAVALIDVVGPTTPLVDGVGTESGVGAAAAVTLTTNHANDLILLGVSGQEKDSPFAPTSGETLLDTAGNTSGPFDDGEGMGTFSASSPNTAVVLSVSLENPAVWNAIGVGIVSTATHSVADHGPLGGGSVTTVAGFALAAVARRR